MFLDIIIFLAGLLLLVLSADWLIQGSIKLSFLFKLTPLFVGMVLVAFGTSMPEAGVGIMAAIRNQKGLALGNIIGSNIANIGLILGVCALFRPLKIDKSIFKREMPAIFFSIVLFYLLCQDRLISRVDGAIFIVFFIGFCLLSYKGAKKSFNPSEVDTFKFKGLFKRTNSRFSLFVIIALSLLGIVFGADLMVRGGSSIARHFGVSPWLIGITIFAIGTSLPELVTSLSASIKRVSSISVGNIIGSNIFNILFVLGIVALIRPISIDLSVLRFEVPLLFIFSCILFTVMRTGYKISRKEGLIMFLSYIGFLVVLIIKRI